MIRGRLLGALLVTLVLIGFVFSGCAKKPAETTAAQLEEGGVAVEVTVTEGRIISASRHTVKKGECLWWIAEYRDIYNDPFQWPLIYDANKDQIKDPDLIYPGQAFFIPRGGYTIEEVKEARRKAGAPRPYTPPAEAFVPTG